MPEGDTVHRTAARLHGVLAGAVLTRTDFRVPRFATTDLGGRHVDEVVARGKHILHHIGDLTIHSHLRMEGRWDIYQPGARWQHPGYQARAVIDTTDVSTVGFTLGILELLPRDAEDSVVGHLGPDLLGPDWDPTRALAGLTANPDRPIGVALLDQTALAGVGNVYRNEICFLRGILPTRPVATIRNPAAVIDLAKRLIVANRDRAARVTTGIDRNGRRLWVYGRRGQPCLRCGTPIRSGTLGDPSVSERTTFWCPNCQH